VYTTPKKIKHKRKKTKLAILKYYKVDGDGKIERLRRECPTETVSSTSAVERQSRILMINSVELVSSWLLCITANTAANAILPTSSTSQSKVKTREMDWHCNGNVHACWI